MRAFWKQFSSSKAEEQEQDQEQQQQQEEAPKKNSGMGNLLKSLPVNPGVLLLLVGSLCDAAVGLMVKELKEFDPIMLMVYQYVFNSVFGVAYMLYTGNNKIGKKLLPAFFVLRVAFILYVASLFFGFRYLPLGDIRTLHASQLIFAGVLTWLVLGERFWLPEIQTTLVVLVGIVMVTNPPTLFGDGGGASNIVYDSTYYTTAGISIAGAFCMAVVFICMRSLRSVNPFVLSAWGALAVVLPLLLAALLRDALALPTWNRVPLLLLLCALTLLQQICMFTALRFVEALPAAVTRRAFDILLAFALQLLWFRQVPGAVSVLGSVLITATVTLEGARKHERVKEEKRRKEEEEKKNSVSQV